MTSDREMRWHEKEDFIDEFKALYGFEPVALRHILTALTHPNLIDHTRKFLASYGSKKENRCLLYSDPWSCVREAEARYETIKFGWLGAASGVGFDESWCDNCRARVMQGTLD